MLEASDFQPLSMLESFHQNNRGSIFALYLKRERLNENENSRQLQLSNLVISNLVVVPLRTKVPVGSYYNVMCTLNLFAAPTKQDANNENIESRTVAA